MNFRQTSYEGAEKVYVVIQNNQGAALEPGYVVEWSLTATDADQGHLVELTDSDAAVATSAGGVVAGVVETTIATGEIGRIQVYGPAAVTMHTTVAAGIDIVANTAGKGLAASTAASGVGYQCSYIGRTFEASPTAATNTIQLQLM